MKAYEVLDGFVLSSEMLKAATLEMDRFSANKFLFDVSKHFENLSGNFGAVRNVIGLGEKFSYKGVYFRVVER